MRDRLAFVYDVQLSFTQAVHDHCFLLRCLPPSFCGQNILDVQLVLEPCVPFALQKDSFGNLLQIGRITPDHHYFRYTVRGTAEVDIALRLDEPCPPFYRFASPYTPLSSEMGEFLQKLSLPEQPDEKALELCHAVHNKLCYLSGSTSISTRAPEAFAKEQGVCQDYAHVFLSLARASGLAARYVSGLTVGEGASHAWCEVWQNGIWIGIDPTRDKLCDNSYIRFNVGRDYGDCPMERGIFTGITQQDQQIFMRVDTQ